MSSSTSGMSASGSGDENASPDEIQEEIEHTRDEMSETINAIQEKLNPDVLKEHAKEVIHDATVGKAQDAVSSVTDSAKEAVSNVTDTARDMVSSAGDTARETAQDFRDNPVGTASRAGTSLVEQVRANPIPFALAGAGLGLLYMRRSSSQNKTQPYYYYPDSPRGQDQRMSQDRSQTTTYQYGSQQYGSQGQSAQQGQYGTQYQGQGSQQGQYRAQYQGQQHESEGTMSHVGHMAGNAGSSILDVIKQNPVPAALAGGTLAWFLKNRSSGSNQGGTQSYYYQPSSTGMHTHAQYPSGSQTATRTQYAEGTQYPYNEQYGSETDYVSGARPQTELFQQGYAAQYRSGSGSEGESEGQGVTGTISNAASSVAGTASSAASSVAGTASNVGQTVGHTTVSAGSSVIDLVKQNPIPAALTGVGIGWMLMNRSSGDQSQRGTQSSYYQPGRYSGQSGYSSYGQQSQGTQGQYSSYGQQSRGSQDSEGGAMSAVTGTLSGAASSVTDTLSDATGAVTDTASQVGQQAREQFSNFGDTAQNQTQRVTGWYDQMLHESPMTLAALALGAGLAVGMSIPETQKENQLLGAQRDNLMEKAQDVAQNTVEKVQAVAQEVGTVAQDAAKDAAQQVKSTAQDAAKDEGLTGQGQTG